MDKYENVNEIAKGAALTYEDTKKRVETYLKYSGDVDKAKALRFLWEHRTRGLTQHDAYKYNDYRLSAKIMQLREDGFAIYTVDEPNSIKQGTHGRYFLLVTTDILKNGEVLVRECV